MIKMNSAAVPILWTIKTYHFLRLFPSFENRISSALSTRFRKANINPPGIDANIPIRYARNSKAAISVGCNPICEKSITPLCSLTPIPPRETGKLVTSATTGIKIQKYTKGVQTPTANAAK